MPRDRKLFDPLYYLQRELRLKVWIGRNDRILLDGLNSLGQEHVQRALWVVRTYDKLLRVQLNDPRRPSVYKLIAQGKMAVRKGRYVSPASSQGDHTE
jgi:hypothetical protein